MNAAPAMVLALAVSLLMAFGSPADVRAQTVRPAERGWETSPEPTILDYKAEQEGEAIKSQTYRSTPIGSNQNWSLDIGRFQSGGPDDPVSLDERLDQLHQGYAGMRLRVPLRGR